MQPEDFDPKTFFHLHGKLNNIILAHYHTIQTQYRSKSSNGPLEKMVKFITF